MFLLDTCFVSEFTRKTPDPGFIAWLDQQAPSDLLITTLTLGEIAKGIERLPMSRKRTDLEIWFTQDLLARFAGRIVSFDEAAGFEWGRLCARLEMGGFMMPAVDSQIAAICLLRGADLADFAHSGVRVVNPWTQPDSKNSETCGRPKSILPPVPHSPETTFTRPKRFGSPVTVSSTVTRSHTLSMDCTVSVPVKSCQAVPRSDRNCGL